MHGDLIMWNFLLMIAFSLYLIGYGYIALFKREWLAKLSGSTQKNDQSSANFSQARSILAWTSLVFGGIGLVMTIVTMVIVFQSQNGGFAV